MKHRKAAASVCLLGSLLLVAAGIADCLAQEPERNNGAGSYIHRLISPEELGGRSVQTRQGEQVGTVDTVLLDHRQGRVAYLLVRSKGLRGSDEQRIVIPWKAVNVQGERPEALEQERWKQQPGLQPGIEDSMTPEHEPAIILEVDRKTLLSAPRLRDESQLPDRWEAERIHSHYGVTPYWERSAPPPAE